MNCALCEKEPRSENSHIVPAFVYRWLKKTSATGFLRGTENPNRRIQDGEKYPLLCQSCEDLLQVHETEFANTIFHPYVETQKFGAVYDEHCLKFCASIVWRALHHLWIVDDEKPLQPELVGLLEEPYAAWKRFILGELPHPNGFTVNLILVDNVTSATTPNTPNRISQYNTGAVDMDLICNSSCGYVYAKLPYFLMFGKVFDRNKRTFSKNTQVRRRRGTLGGRNIGIDQNIIDYIFSRASSIDSGIIEMSEAQQRAIEKAVHRNPERALKSRSFSSFIFDQARSKRD